MRALGSWLGGLGILALTGLPAPTGAQPVGSEFQINTYTTSSQRTVGGDNLVAADASGNFVVVWRSYGQDGNKYGIFGQRYDNTGGALGNEFRVNSFTTLRQDFPTVASDASGNFVVAWLSQSQDGSGDGIFGQRYDSSGVAQGVEFRVNSFTTGHQRIPSVASDVSGNFVVAWQGAYDGGGPGIFGQRYDSGGGTLGSEFRVNSYTTGASIFPPLPPTRAGTSSWSGTALARATAASSASATTVGAGLWALSSA